MAFLLRDAMHSADCAVCLSVCHTPVLYQNDVHRRVATPYYSYIPNDGNMPMRIPSGGIKIVIFDQYLALSQK